MSVSQDGLVGSLSDILFSMPQTAGYMDPLPINGMRGRMTPLSHPFLNLVGLDPAVLPAADIVDQVKDLFAHRGQAWGWLTSPGDSPAVVGRLENVCGDDAVEIAGMVLTDLKYRNPSLLDSGAVELVDAGEDVETFSRVYSEAYGLPYEVVLFLNQHIFFKPSRFRVSNYLACLRDSGKPVGVAGMMMAPDSDLVYLAGSATLKDYRGRGVYRAMMEVRLRDAAVLGASAAMILAQRKTSAEPCRHMGFREVSSHRLYCHI